LYEDALVYESGSAITSSGALSAYSGAKTGRSPSDKRIVKEPSSEGEIWWGPVNKEMSPEVRRFFGLEAFSFPNFPAMGRCDLTSFATYFPNMAEAFVNAGMACIWGCFPPHFGFG